MGVSILGRFEKQPAEILDYAVDYTPFFVGRQDTPASASVTVTTGLTLVSSTLSGNVVRAVLSGGADGDVHAVRVLLTTSSGVVREADFVLKIKQV